MSGTETPSPNPRSNPWLPVVFGLIFLFGAGGTYYVFAQDVPLPKQPVTLKADKTKEAIIQPVKEMLTLIKGGQIDKAYKLHVSSEFKESMPQENFREFVQQYSALTTYSSLTFSSPRAEGEKSFVTAYLHGDGETIPAQFSLVEEEGKWRVSGFILNQSEDIERVDLEDLKELFPVIKYQLSRLRDGEIKRAYNGIVSKKFQKTTPYDSFVSFVKEHPILTKQKQAMAIHGETSGTQASLTVMVRDENEEATILYNLVQEEGKWKILGMKVLTPTLEEEAITEKQQQSMMQVIGFFLAALHEGKEELAYDKYTSDSFKKTSSKEVLSAFTDNHPLLKKGGKAKYIDGGIHDRVASVYVSFGKEPRMILVLFRMVQDEGRWKILGMSVQSETEVTEGTLPKSIKSKEIVDQIKHWLFLIGNNDITTLYFGDTSEEFQESTSLDQFARFVKDHPILSENPQAELIDMTKEEQVLQVTLNLSAPDNSEEAEFELVYSNGKWLLLRMEMKSPLIINSTETESAEPKIVVGTTISPEGFIADPTHSIEGVNQQIHLSLYLPNAKRGDQVTIVLVHQASDSKSPPLVTSINESGNSIISYAYSPPKEGWPVGDYEFEITTTDGTTITYPLIIKE